MSETNKSAPQRLSFSIDFKVLVVILLLVIIGMLAAWRPWNKSNTSTRTVQVTGEATVKAEPDNYVFYPTYEFKNSNPKVALSDSVKKTEEIVNKLKTLGVGDKDIKTNTNGYNSYKPSPISETDTDLVYNASLTITVDSRDKAQKIQDYLVTTSPTGAVTPQATFSESKRKELESTGRDEATKDARKKADQNARNLGFKVGAVKEVSDGQGFSIMPFEGGYGTAVRDTMATSSLPVQPGENELRYSVTVTYFVR